MASLIKGNSSEDPITEVVKAKEKKKTSLRKVKKPAIYCGVRIVSKKKNCRSRVKKKGDRCIYHREREFPFKNVTYNTNGPIIPYKWKDWNLTYRGGYVDRQLRIVLRQAHEKIKTDRPGWIYVYYLKDDESTTYWKIGRTSRTKVEVRISEWPGAIMRLAVKVPFNELAERLIHLILDDKRLIRYVYGPAGKKSSGKVYLTTQKRTRDLVKDNLVEKILDLKQKPKDFLPVPERDVQAIREGRPVNFGNRKKEIEWFQAKLSIIKDVIEVVNISLVKWKSGE